MVRAIAIFEEAIGEAATSESTMSSSRPASSSQSHGDDQVIVGERGTGSKQGAPGAAVGVVVPEPRLLPTRRWSEMAGASRGGGVVRGAASPQPQERAVPPWVSEAVHEEHGVGEALDYWESPDTGGASSSNLAHGASPDQPWAPGVHHREGRRPREDLLQFAEGSAQGSLLEVQLELDLEMELAEHLQQMRQQDSDWEQQQEQQEQQQPQRPRQPQQPQQLQQQSWAPVVARAGQSFVVASQYNGALVNQVARPGLSRGSSFVCSTPSPAATPRAAQGMQAPARFVSSPVYYPAAQPYAYVQVGKQQPRYSS